MNLGFQDVKSLPPGEIIAPDVGNSANDPNYHNNFQDPEAFLALGGNAATVSDPHMRLVFGDKEVDFFRVYENEQPKAKEKITVQAHGQQFVGFFIHKQFGVDQ